MYLCLTSEKMWQKKVLTCTGGFPGHSNSFPSSNWISTCRSSFVQTLTYFGSRKRFQFFSANVRLNVSPPCIDCSLMADIQSRLHGSLTDEIRRIKKSVPSIVFDWKQNVGNTIQSETDETHIFSVRLQKTLRARNDIRDICFEYLIVHLLRTEIEYRYRGTESMMWSTNFSTLLSWSKNTFGMINPPSTVTRIDFVLS